MPLATGEKQPLIRVVSTPARETMGMGHDECYTLVVTSLVNSAGRKACDSVDAELSA